MGGSREVHLSKEDFTAVKSASKPTQMALRLADKLFSKDTLRKSTVQGTKEFAALDINVMAAIKGKLGTFPFSFGKQQVLIVSEYLG